MKLSSGNYGGIADILKDKAPNVLEIEVTLFENCDVACSFCGHEKDRTDGMSKADMFKKLDLVEKYIETANKDVEFANVHLLGGELFQDRLIQPDNGQCYLELYMDWAMAYKKVCLKNGLTPRIAFVTNNLSTKCEEIKNFLDAVRREMLCDLIVSYDVSGRPITRQYRHNIGFFKGYIANLNMVATSETIEAIMEAKDPYFHTLYCDFPIYIDDFLPDPESEHLIPSDELLFDFMKFCLEKYPKLMPYSHSVEVMRSGSNQPVEISGSTLNKITILPNDVVTNYAWERHDGDFWDRPFILEDNTNMLYDFVMENNCLSCEHFSYCHMRCPVQWSWKNRERSNGCVNKRFYDYINK